MIALEYENFSLTADHTPVLDQVNLTFHGPGVVSLLGPSGVGKSTLLHATQRLIEDGKEGWHRQGKIYLNGKDIFDSKLRPQDLAGQIGFIQQKPRMLGGSVRDNVEFALKYTTRLSRKQIRQKAEACLEQVGVTEELESLEVPAWKLSGGQAQRVAIARAMALDPQVLLMDEPSSALDPVKSQQLETVIRSISQNHLVLLVTHDVALAERLASYAAFLDRGAVGGKIVESGAIPHIFNHPQHALVKEFIRIARSPIHYENGAPLYIEPASNTMPSLLQRVYLFICGGNTIRSPIAQAICNVEVARLLNIDPKQLKQCKFRALSAGISPKSGATMTQAAKRALSHLGISPPEHETRPVTQELIQEADTIYCMTDEQCLQLVQHFPISASKVQRLDPAHNIQDPHGGDPNTFLEIARHIQELVRWRLESQIRFPLSTHS